MNQINYPMGDSPSSPSERKHSHVTYEGSANAEQILTAGSTEYVSDFAKQNRVSQEDKPESYGMIMS